MSRSSYLDLAIGKWLESGCLGKKGVRGKVWGPGFLRTTGVPKGGVETPASFSSSARSALEELLCPKSCRDQGF